MEAFLGHFEDGRLISLASEIGDPDILLPDIKGYSVLSIRLCGLKRQAVVKFKS